MRQNPPNIGNIQMQQLKNFPDLPLTSPTLASLKAVASERQNTVLAFLQHMKASGVGTRRLESCALAIRSLETLRKDYMDISKKDLEGWIVHWEPKHSPSTMNLFKITIKQFFKWLYIDDPDTGEYPAVVKWVKVGRIKASYGKRVLSKEDVLKMMEHTDNPRDRALIHVLYESACRASELLNIKLKDITFDRYGAVVRVNGKTGERRVRLIESIPDLTVWMNMRPEKNDPESALWVSNLKPFEPIKLVSLQAIVYKIAIRASLPKGISPHSFRHARATFLAQFLTEAQLREVLGWEKDSKMPSIYVHLSGKNVDDTILRVNGIKPEESQERASPTAPKTCPRCKTQNGPAAKFCMQCSSPMDIRTALMIEEKTARAEEITAKVIEAIIRKAPDLVTQVLKEQGLLNDIQRVADRQNMF